MLGFAAAAWPLIRALWKYIVIIAALVALYLFVHSKLVDWADARAKPQIDAITAERDAARAELSTYRDQQRAKAAQLVLDWNSARDRSEALQKELDSERAKRFAGLAERARAGAGVSGGLRLPDPLVGVLDESIRAANSATAPGPTPVPSEDSPAVTLADLAAAKVTCDQYYADAVDQILGLQKFYRDVQSAQPQQ